MRFLTLILCLTVLPRLLSAAEIVVVGPPTLFDSHSVACTLQLSGRITAGDADTLQTLLERQGYLDDGQNSVQALCLDSPGGSLNEGVKIAEVLTAYSVPTVLAEGAECLSACAVAFMGGTLRFDIYTPIQRSMHPTARLGFHAPDLEVPERSYDRATVTKAFDLAIDAIARIAKDLDEANSMSRVNKFPRSLLAEMLRHKGKDFLWVDTVEKAAVWGIDVDTKKGVGRQAVDPVLLCMLVLRRFRDQPIVDFSPGDLRTNEAMRRDYTDVLDRDWSVWVNNFSNDFCDIKHYDFEPRYRVTASEYDALSIGDRSFNSWVGYRPDTLLRDLR
ncbi:hypothetical protein [Antarctobacter sp.]|uniref:COG3904 family protein n=1 Tax=Antarctobacter sp. TaxID=1872577 RepID=UPI002B26D082|nr:hypothetical protein [Antarctobacter sp.]